MRLSVIAAYSVSKQIPNKNINFFFGHFDLLRKILADHNYGKNKEKRVNDFYNSIVYTNQ